MLLSLVIWTTITITIIRRIILLMNKQNALQLMVS